MILFTALFMAQSLHGMDIELVPVKSVALHETAQIDSLCGSLEFGYRAKDGLIIKKGWADRKKIMKFLIEQGQRHPDCIECFGKSALFEAACEADEQFVDYLKNHGAELLEYSCVSDPQIPYEAFLGDLQPEVITTLFKAGFDPCMHRALTGTYLDLIVTRFKYATIQSNPKSSLTEQMENHKKRLIQTAEVLTSHGVPFNTPPGWNLNTFKFNFLENLLITAERKKQKKLNFQDEQSMTETIQKTALLRKKEIQSGLTAVPNVLIPLILEYDGQTKVSYSQETIIAAIERIERYEKIYGNTSHTEKLS